jgi:hypothetical protein
MVVFSRLTRKIVNKSPKYVIKPNLKGFLAATYLLSTIYVLPFILWINQHLR